MYTRYLQHVQKAQRNFGSAEGTVVDVDQNASHSSPSWAFPPRITHGTFVKVDTGEILMAEEHLLVQGEAIAIANPDQRFQCCLNPFIDALKKSSGGCNGLKRIAGNSMSTVNLFSFQLYCLANLQVF